MRRNTSIALALAGLIIAFLLVLTRVGAQGAAVPPKSYYVALGDSNAHGHTTDTAADDPQCHSPKAPGYVCVVYRYLLKKYPAVRVRNFSRSGADSCEVAGAGHGCQDTVPRTSQLVPATAFLRAHRGHIRLVTIDIGGNDVLELALQGLANLPAIEAKLPAIYAAYRTNLDIIFKALRAAAPHAKIVASTQWNPLGGIGSPPLPAGFAPAAQGALDAINGIVQSETAKQAIIVADAAATMNAYPGGGVALSYVLQTALTGTPNIHPTPRGHRIWANVIIKAAFGANAR